MGDKQTVPHRDWALSIGLFVVLGCLLIAFGWLLIFKVVAGLLFPFLSVALMVGVHALVGKVREQALDQQNVAIQLAVIGGGILSVGAAFLIDKSLSPVVLAYAGGGMALLASITILLEQARVASKRKAAEKALRDAEEAHRLAEDGDTKTAEEMFKEALLTTEIAYGSNHSQIATIVFYMGQLMQRMERDEAASVLFRRAVDVRTAIQDGSEKYVLNLQACADHLRDVGLHEEALSYINKAVTESRKLENSNALTGRCYLTQARIFTAQKNLQEAYDAGKAAVHHLEQGQGKSHPETLEAKSLMASHCVGLGRMAEADRILVEVMADKEKLGEDKDSVYVDLLLDLSSVHSKSKVEKSKEFLLKAAHLYRGYVGPEYHRAEELLSRLPSQLAEGVHPDLSEFFAQMFTGQTRAASIILESKPELASLVDASGWTILQWGVFFDNSEITRITLSQGADIEAGKESDFPPLYIGTRWANRAALSTLFRKDPDVEIQAVGGRRPIHAAVLSRDQLTFDQVCSKKATLEVADQLGWTPLHLAAFKGDRKFLLQLIPKGLDVNFQAPTSMQTPLHAAVLGGHRGAAETLILNAAHLDLQDAEGHTPADLAVKKGHQDIVELIQGYDVKEEEPQPVAEEPPPEASVPEPEVEDQAGEQAEVQAEGEPGPAAETPSEVELETVVEESREG